MAALALLLLSAWLAGPAAAAIPPANTSPPVFSDATPHDGDRLTVYPGKWSGSTPISYSYAWQRCSSSCVTLGSGQTYTVVPGDVGSRLTVRVTAANAAGSTVATSSTAVVAAALPRSTALPVVTGTAAQGQVLTASTGSWTGTAPISFAYRWRRCDAAGGNCATLVGATSRTYTPVAADGGSTLRVQVAATNAAGTATASSNATAVVPAQVPANTSPPVFSDATPHDGDRLTVYPGSWSGTTPISYGYEWRRCSSSCVTLGSGQTYTVVPGDVGSRLVVQVRASNRVGATVASATSEVVGAALPRATALPGVTGIAAEGEVLTVSNGSWTGTAPISYAYRWRRCDTAGGNCATLVGATSRTYTPVAADGGSTLRGLVLATNGAGTVTASSNPTAVVAATAPQSTAPPVVSGTAADGLALTTTQGTWSVTQQTSYTIDWARCSADGAGCTTIPGATGATYVATPEDVGHRLQSRVRASNGGGSAAAVSAPTAVVVARAAPTFVDAFDRPDGLIANGYGFVNPAAAGIAASSDWELTSGSFFVRQGRGWTGVPDDVYPNATSSNGTGSAIFRLRTMRSDFGDVAMTFRLLVNGLTATGKTPATTWDGVHVWLRYQDETSLYALSVSRRDDLVVVKKKCPGGPSNGGTYVSISPYLTRPAPVGVWEDVQATVETNGDGSVSLGLYVDGELVVGAVDRGTGCAPITGVGAAGIRGDNADFDLDDVAIRPL